MSLTSPVSYSNVVDAFAPLDLILYRGVGFVSDTIRFLEQEELKNGEFSHSGILVNSDLLPHVKELQPGNWYVLESTFSATKGLLEKYSTGLPNVLTGRGKFGVQIVNFAQEVPAYEKNEGAAVAWCQLINNPWKRRFAESDTDYAIRKREIIEDIWEVFQKYGARSYDWNCLDLCAALYPCLRPARNSFREVLVGDTKILSSVDLHIDPTGWLFCSELVALVYRDLDILPPSINPLNWVPVNFLGAGKSGIKNLVETPIYLKS
jgi:hypothetical protein